MPDLMTQAAYATSRGISKQAIGDLVKRGIITLVDGKVDPAYADMQRANALNPAKSKSLRVAGGGSLPGDGAGPGKKVTELSEYQRHRAERERLEMLTAELDYRKAVGELIDRAGVLRGLSEASRMLRDQVMGLPRRLAPELAGCNDKQKAERQLEAELRGVLDQFAHSLIARLNAEANEAEKDQAADG